MKVQKKSGKPFKSRLVINTVKGETINPYTNKEAYTFYEDDSIVDKHMCEVIEPLIGMTGSGAKAIQSCMVLHHGINVMIVDHPSVIRDFNPEIKDIDFSKLYPTKEVDGNLLLDIRDGEEQL